MRKIVALAIILSAVVSCAVAQEGDQVFVVTELPKGKTIRLAVKDSTGKITDAGQFIAVSEYQRVVAVAAKLQAIAERQMKEWMAYMYPEAHKALTDTAYTIIKKSLIPPPPKKKK